MQVDHWMTFSTFAEQRFFIYPTPQTYKGVIINANMIAHAPDGMTAFLLEKTKTANFIINPLTHAFQHNIKYILSNKEGEIKSSIRKLAEEYGSPFIDIVGKRSINSNDFQNAKKRKEMTARCIEFQRNKLQSSNMTNDIDKYLTKTERILNPYVIIPPYFYLTELSYKDWVSIMKDCVSDVINIKRKEEKLFVAIVISQGVLSNRSIINKIVSYFPNVNGFLVWVDNFDEQAASMLQLKNFIYLCKKLKGSSNNEVINLHGGYFSILMAGKAGNNILSGVAHGPEFGEYRSVVPVGGGIPIAKYYIPKLYSRIKYRDAAYILDALNWLKNSDIFHQNVCSCPMCEEVINGNIDNFSKFGLTKTKEIKRKGKTGILEYPLKNTKEICLKHYLNVKKEEYNKVIDWTKKDLLSELENNQNLFKDVTGIEFVSYLEKWKKALNSVSGI